MTTKKFYKLKFDSDNENFATLNSVTETTYEFNQSFNGDSQLKSWKPIIIQKSKDNNTADIADANAFPLFPIFSKKAIECLMPVMANDIEILPLIFNDDADKFFGINIIKVLDVVDYNKSDIVRFKNSNKILAFRKIVLKNELITDNIFKIIDMPIGCQQFVSEEFKKIVKENNLTGFIFEPVNDDN